MTKFKVELTLFLTILIVALFFIAFGPFIQIWAVNTLFKTNIEYSLLNWAAVIVLNSSVSAFSYRGK